MDVLFYPYQDLRLMYDSKGGLMPLLEPFIASIGSCD